MIKDLWHDKLYGAAIIAAPLFCLALLFSQLPFSVDWLQPFNYPKKFILLSFVYPILEEIVFRGLLQGTLLKWGMRKRLWRGISQANGLTSIVFMLAHFIYHSWIWAVAVLVPSVIFGYFRDKYQSITPSIILHVFYNFVYFLTFGFNL